MNVYQNNTYKKDLNWTLFNNDQIAQKRQKVKDEQSYMLVFVAYLTFLTSSQQHQPKHGNSIPCKAVS